MHEPHGAPPSGKVLEAMLTARRQMNRCIERFDALVYTPHDRGFTERGLDQVLLDTMRALRRVYMVRMPHTRRILMTARELGHAVEQLDVC